MAYIRAHWQVRIIAYMDDVLLLHQDRNYLELATLQIGYYLQCLGWTLNLDKCELTPQQEIVFLGWRWCFRMLTPRMTAEMRKELLLQLKRWLVKAESGERVSWRKLGSLVGCLNFLRAQIPRASLYLRTLHSALAAGVKLSGWNGWGMMPRRTISEMLFWYRNVWYNTPYGFAARLPQAMLTTDASEKGWGAVIQIGGVSYTTYGSYSPEHCLKSSNWRETTAVLRALLYFKPLIQQGGIRALPVRTDNMVAVFNLQRQGASESLVYETRQIFSLLQRMDVRISVTHIPGIENVMADALSRMDRVGDYGLGKEWYERGTKCLGVTPTLDVFASSNNNKCQRFLALPGRLSKGAVALDALRYS
jgi:hypothetical protein